jgi:hypothetical protein
MSAAARVLDRLTKVKQTGQDKWIACCPAHGDKSPSLSVREVEDRLLIHCFAGCGVDDVLGALGLEFRDLFDAPIEHRLRPTHSRIPARDVLELISHEIDVAALVLADAVEQRQITDENWHRLATASRRIGQARGHTYG